MGVSPRESVKCWLSHEVATQRKLACVAALRLGLCSWLFRGLTPTATVGRRFAAGNEGVQFVGCPPPTMNQARRQSWWAMPTLRKLVALGYSWMLCEIVWFPPASRGLCAIAIHSFFYCLGITIFIAVSKLSSFSMSCAHFSRLLVGMLVSVASVSSNSVTAAAKAGAYAAFLAASGMMRLM